MSSISQAKDRHWKLVSNRKSRMDSVFDQGAAKKKFTPLKDNSMHDSKVFERSRQRSNSSFTGLNKSRDTDTVQIRDKKNDKILESSKAMHPERSVMVSTLRNSEFRLKDSVELSKHYSSAMKTITEVQKQFKQFKEKVMKLIQRQQQQINQLAKEILNTFQFQLTKLKDLKINKCEHCQFQKGTQKLDSKSLQPLQISQTNSKLDVRTYNKSKPKQIQELKQEFKKKLEKIQKSSPILKTDEKSNTQLQKSKSARQIPILNFSKIHSRFDNVFDIFNKLKSEMNEMEEINFGLQKKKAAQTNLTFQALGKN